MNTVLFDWRGTLVVDPPDSWWVAKALTRIGRSSTRIEVDDLVDRLAIASSHPKVEVLRGREDSDAVIHRELHDRLCALAGLDEELARSLYELDLQPDSHPFYEDVAGVLRALHVAGVRVGVLGNVHFDLRPEFAQAGLSEYIDAFVLSFEAGMQKPDPRYFELALDRLDASPATTLMVGDRATIDGGAAAVGILSIILPPLRHVADRGLRMVTRLVGIETA